MICPDKHPNKVITVTGDDQPTTFTSLIPLPLRILPPAGSHFLFRLVYLSLHTTLAGIQQEKASSA